MTKIIHRVDAFADDHHKGNPAGAYLLEEDLTTETLQDIALRAGLPITTFLKRLSKNEFDIRWFTMNVEVNLCGHGTVAGVYFLYEKFGLREMHFKSKSGPLTCKITDDAKVEMDFPAQKTNLCNDAQKKEIENALGVSVKNCYFGFEDYLVELESSQAVANFQPNFEKILAVDCRGIIITAWDEEYGYNCVSRFFCPRVAINEDQVCVSAHCKILPYWQEKRSADYLHAWQASPNSGELHLYALEENRVKIQGSARIKETITIS